MSDIDSIVSEDISVHTDVSEAYDPEAADGDDYYDDFDAASTGSTDTGKQPPPAPARVLAPTVATAKSMLSGPATKPQARQPQKDLPNIKNISVIKSEQSYEYSSGFDDDYENDFDSYNDDFEDDASEKRSEKKTTTSAPGTNGLGSNAAASKAAVPTILVGNTAITLPTIPLINLPQIDSQSLQAEMALQEISKEVVRLRNQQRTLLQERRQMAREKMVRAEARRSQYLAELQLLRDRAVEAEAKNIVLNDTVESLKRDLEIANNSKESFRHSITVLETTNKDLNDNIVDLQTQLETSRQECVTKDREMAAKEKQWEEEKKSLNQEVTRNLLRIEVAEKSIDSNNDRVARERERLPAEHQRRLDDALARYSALENSLKEREGAMRAEETRRLTDIEQKSRQYAEDAARTRQRFDGEMAEERSKLKDSRKEIEQERTRIESRLGKERTELSLAAMDLTRRESALTEELASINRARGELEAAQSTVEPSLRAMVADREAARQAAQEAGRVLREAEERTSSVLAAERGLIKRENELQRREEAVEAMRTKLLSESRIIHSEAKRLASTRKSIDDERFSLHEAAVELSSQASEVRRAASMVTKQHTSGGGATSVAALMTVTAASSSSPTTLHFSNALSKIASLRSSKEQLTGTGPAADASFMQNENIENFAAAAGGNSAVAVPGDRSSSFYEEFDRRRASSIPMPNVSYHPTLLRSMHSLDGISVNMQHMAESLAQPYQVPANDSSSPQRLSSKVRAGSSSGAAVAMPPPPPLLSYTSSHFDEDLAFNRPATSVLKRRPDLPLLSKSLDDFGGFSSAVIEAAPPSILRTSIDGASQSVESLKAAAAKFGLFAR